MRLAAYYDDRCTAKRFAVGATVMLSLALAFATVVLSRGFLTGINIDKKGKCMASVINYQNKGSFEFTSA